MRKTTIALCAAAALATAAPASAQRTLDPIRDQPIERLGADVIRFSSRPALGGPGYVIEVWKTRAGVGGRQRILATDDRRGWRVASERPLTLDSAEFDRLARGVDEALTRPVAGEGERADQLIVCTDGPGWLTERNVGMTTRTLDGFCGANHPNKAVETLFAPYIPR